MHDVFTIDLFRGKATNQKTRMTNAPTRVVGAFDRLGGVNGLPQYYTTPTNLIGIGYDWTGVSAWYDSTNTSNITMYYSQYGTATTVDASAMQVGYVMYVPGGGMYSLKPGVGTVTDPSIPSIFYVKADGTPTFRGPPDSTWAPNITQIAGTIPSGSIIHVVFIYFVRTPHGYMPWGLMWNSHTLTADGGWQISKTGASYAEDVLLNAYVRVSTPSDGVIAEWDRLYSGPENESPFLTGDPDYFITDVSMVTSNASPHFYGAYSDIHNYPPSNYTTAVDRAFYIHYYNTVFGLDIEDAYPYRLQLKRYDPTMQRFSKQNVMFTDEGYLAFSDGSPTNLGPNYLSFDDVIRAITPSVRGIYAFSDVGTWEAFGDFETAQGTRISLIPQLGGVDGDGYNVTFSGDTAYFIKNGYVHAIGPAGIREIGKPIHMNSVKPSAVYYDRFNRMLLVRLHDALAVYFPSTDQWAEFPLALTGQAGQDTLCVVNDDQIIFNGHVVQMVPTATPPTTIEIMFEKIDMGKPNRRKRIHRIVVPYDGNFTSVSAQIADTSSGTYRQCTVSDRGGYFEIRCPSIVARAFSFVITAEPVDYNFAINPPVTFEYDQYGAEYGRT